MNAFSVGQYIPRNTNLDDFIKPGSYTYNGYTHYEGDVPFTNSWGILFVTVWPGQTLQFIFNVTTHAIYYRIRENKIWQTWGIATPALKSDLSQKVDSYNIGSIQPGSSRSVTLDKVRHVYLVYIGQPYSNDAGLYIVTPWEEAGAGKIIAILESNHATLSLDKMILTVTCKEYNIFVNVLG